MVIAMRIESFGKNREFKRQSRILVRAIGFAPELS